MENQEEISLNHMQRLQQLSSLTNSLLEGGEKRVLRLPICNHHVLWCGGVKVDFNVTSTLLVKLQMLHAWLFLYTPLLLMISRPTPIIHTLCYQLLQGTLTRGLIKVA